MSTLKVEQGTAINVASQTPPPNFQLTVAYASQGSYLNLCWAACCQMVLACLGAGHFGLCEVASKTLGPNCCSNLSACDQTAWPEKAYAAYNFVCHPAGGAMAIESIRNWVASGQPVQPYLKWYGGGSHTVLIVGYFENGDVMVYDPKWGVGRQTHDYVVRGYGMGTWQDTWYNFMRTTGAAIA